MPQKIQDQIQYLCQRINKVEWSGVMFYSVKGGIKDFDKMELTIEDIFPMDKGSAGATGYELGDEIIEYRMNNPESLSWKMGMIHSHHNMKAYFSGTDMEELEDNTAFHNYYLSLVVNNSMDFVAKVAFRGDIKGYECKDEAGKGWNLKLSKNRQVMFTFDCEIDTPVTLTKVPSTFAERTAEIIKDADKKSYQYAQGVKQKEWEKTKFLPKHNKKPVNFQKEMDEEFDKMDEASWNDSFSWVNENKSKKDMSQDERYWDFTLYLLRLGEPMEKDSLEGVLEDIDAGQINITEYVNKVLVMYPALFEKYWDIFGEINTERFVETTNEVYSILENYEGLFEPIEALLEGIGLMIIKMETNG